MAVMSDTTSPAAWAKMYQKAKAANWAIQTARQALRTGKTTMDGKSVEDHLFGAQEDTQSLASSLYRAGDLQAVPSSLPEREDAYDLGDLRAMESGSGRELLAALETALALAEKVDAERGNVVSESLPLQPGESRGTDYAEAISGLLVRLRKEVSGARGRE